MAGIKNFSTQPYPKEYGRLRPVYTNPIYSVLPHAIEMKIKLKIKLKRDMILRGSPHAIEIERKIPHDIKLRVPTIMIGYILNI